MIRVLLVDDHRIVRESLSSLLNEKSDIEVVGEIPDGYSAIQLTKKLKPDVVVMDVVLPLLNGIEATREITNKVPRTKVLALSGYFEQRFVMQMLRAGAKGYLLKVCTFEELVRAVRTVFKGQTYLSPEIADVVRTECLRRTQKPDESVFSVLTARERQVLQLIAEGKTTKEIAARFGLSVKTVETHQQHIMQKLNLSNRAMLTRYAVREGLVSLYI